MKEESHSLRSKDSALMHADTATHQRGSEAAGRAEGASRVRAGAPPWARCRAHQLLSTAL